jgi:hypothetical protein
LEKGNEQGMHIKREEAGAMRTYKRERERAYISIHSPNPIELTCHKKINKTF